MADWKEIVIDVAEDEGWNCIFDMDGWAELSILSDAGEDFSFAVDAASPERFWRAMRDYADDFDAEEHAVGWWRAGKGEPDSIRVLLDDADRLAEQMLQLVSEMRWAFIENTMFSRKEGEGR